MSHHRSGDREHSKELECNTILSKKVEELTARLDYLELGNDSSDAVKDNERQMIDKVIERLDKLEDKFNKAMGRLENEMGRLEGLILNSTSGQEADDRRIFVGGLPATVTDRILYDYFSKFGNITNAKVIVDKATACSKGFGFVTFEFGLSRKNALNHKVHVLHDSLIDVKEALTPKDSPRRNGGGSSSATATHDGSCGLQPCSGRPYYGYGPGVYYYPYS